MEAMYNSSTGVSTVLVRVFGWATTVLLACWHETMSHNTINLDYPHGLTCCCKYVPADHEEQRKRCGSEEGGRRREKEEDGGEVEEEEECVRIGIGEKEKLLE